jgi:molybdopterin converting factor small subunit
MVAVDEEMQRPDHVLENGDLVDLVSQMAGG